jgi:hypothetical protein
MATYNGCNTKQDPAAALHLRLPAEDIQVGKRRPQRRRAGVASAERGVHLIGGSRLAIGAHISGGSAGRGRSHAR